MQSGTYFQLNVKTSGREGAGTADTTGAEGCDGDADAGNGLVGGCR